MTASRPVLVVHGTDRPGIVAAVTRVLADFEANIVSLDQYSTDPVGGQFFQRTEFNVPEFLAIKPQLQAALVETVGEGLGLDWTLSDISVPKRVAILASLTDHNLLDLLWRQRRGEINMTVPMVVSNHTVVAEDVRGFGVPFFHVPSQGPDKSAAEAEILALLKGNVDLVVLARYMQILSDDFIGQVGVPVINIHHSFLPAFIGASPYRKAKERGVKLVGATAHYVTKDLDEGPIIEQDVVRVDHADTVEELTRKGAEVERQVLSRAVKWHCEDRIVRAGHQTIVF
ncbi:MAG: formyltetrahydrofolate deformylase [Micrococcales bacterium 73-13]|nr:MAG: formyltetrahydrofolate deformylase [Micrococcales bacterium 73-13]